MTTNRSDDVPMEKLVSDFKAVVADVEELLSATANQTGEKAAATRAKIMERIASAKADLVAAEDELLTKTRQVAQATEHFVRENPWPSVMIAAGVGLLIGLLSRRN